MNGRNFYLILIKQTRTSFFPADWSVNTFIMVFALASASMTAPQEPFFYAH
jgi:hypothetical protein